MLVARGGAMYLSVTTSIYAPVPHDGFCESGVKFAAVGGARGEPVVAAQCARQQMMVPLRAIVVVDVRVLAEQTLD